MRNNQPVTQREYELQESDFLISRTDLKGRITYANPAFIEVSGYAWEELHGANHNLVRHPDMPPVAFANLWETIQQGKPWNGLVMNRRKNGDHYWVRANVTPTVEDGRVVGYTSVRSKPTRGEVAEASVAYREIREGRGKHHGLDRGRLVRRGPLGWLARAQPSSLRFRLWLMMVIALVIVVGCSLTSWMDFIAEGSSLEAIAQMGLALLGAILVVLAVQTSRSVLQAVDASVNYMAQLAAGNLEARLADCPITEMAALIRFQGAIRNSVASIARDVNHSVNSLSVAVEEIARGNEELSTRTEQQAASLQQTAASMEELTATVQQNAGNARHASQLASDASSTVRESGEVMGHVVGTMSQITTTSRKMTEIINVIDSIAFQTNILALNASVEAARAGEQGRGFAVVASEVRNLASRSADASKEIRGLIVSSSQQIDEGAELVQRAEQSIEDVVAAVTKVNDIMGEIAAASDEQSSGIAQVNQAVAQMDDVTQRNAGLVQSAAKASADLEGHLTDALRTMGVFKLRNQPERAAARAPRREIARERRVEPRAPATPPTARREIPAVEEWSEF
ncbi:methyl-accepting chemotaxis sensory transducer with Pas/Pac sensor [Geopseudomonas sagittaria]|uniref:Methyl-accepting chemotaxis sensory transducer with Pas/Pac sensor n=1 Tax=Geopseudomonas sagittaria TaxID=1135990 RepID=A0A1I5QF80_9GAMM|nr:PAS domain-containing methyl-accepting chemotaxis protein [Pseudomonas sagittaria]SFP44787.1 methyl-accepting chemotaxis sensory transducer with Pas/Pac sensor [Pseudomonas sagittaria]